MFRCRFTLVFCNSQLATSQDGIIRVKVFEDRYIVVARPDHAARTAAPLSAAEFARWPLASAGLTPDFRAWLGAIGDPQKQNFEAFLSDDYELICVWAWGLGADRRRGHRSHINKIKTLD
jgi:DNA-binding transcriptional LysR family regulator